MGISLAQCAELVVTTVPEAMGMIRKDMRAWRPEEMTLPQFRILIYLRRHPGASISDVAEYIGLALSSTSQLVDNLMKRDYVVRDIAVSDRRRAIVSLTEDGRAMLEAIYANTRARMAERLAALNDDQRQTIAEAMRLLHGCAAGSEGQG